MARHPTSPRVKRGQEGPDDAFVAGVERTVHWARTHRRTLIVGAVALVALIAGALYYISYQRSIENQATARFTELQGTIASGNTQLALRDLQTFVERFGATDAGERARLILADILLQEGRADEAVDAVRPLARDLDEPRGLAAARLQATAHEELGEVEPAVALYLRVADAARFRFQRQEALADAARVRLQNGNAEEAADLYQRLVRTFEENEAGRGYYEMWLAEAQAQAQGRGSAAVGPVTPPSAGNDTTGAPG